MTLYLNPFYARASEQQRDFRQFVSTFGRGALDILPDPIWDRLVILRSTPGAGKTSLMRMFTVESLEWVRENVNASDPLHRELSDRGVLEERGPRKLGALLSLDRGYRSLLDLPVEPDQARRLFLRLLDVRILVQVMRGALILKGKRYPQDVGAFSLVGETAEPSLVPMIERLGGHSGDALLQVARDTESSILRLLDALLPAEVEDTLEGHNELYSPRVLASGVAVDGEVLDVQPLLMFDDGHELEESQRQILIRELRQRSTTVARWYAERFEALPEQEMLSDAGQQGRDYVLVDLDHIARHGSPDGRRFQKGRYDKVLDDIARRRAAPVLLTYAQERQEFMGLLEEDRDSGLSESDHDVVRTVRTRVSDLSKEDSRYEIWLSEADDLEGWAAAVRWRELEILINRDQDRQETLFGGPLTGQDAEQRSSPALREAAALSVAREFGLPYYGGPNMLVKLGSHNAEQFLTLCGDLFAEMLVDVAVGRQPRLEIRRQHRVLQAASERFWESIPRTIPHGRDVQVLVEAIISIAKEENAKPTVPYPPGVTGTALLMAERARLLDLDYRRRTPGAERLLEALASAIAHNVLAVEMDYSVKNNRYMVIYLNRLLCPRFWLPLGLGSFRERRLGVVVDWMQKLPPTGAHYAPGEERLPL